MAAKVALARQINRGVICEIGDDVDVEHLSVEQVKDLEDRGLIGSPAEAKKASKDD